MYNSLTDEYIRRPIDIFNLILPFLIIRDLVIVTAPWPVFGDPPLVIVDLLQQGETSE